MQMTHNFGDFFEAASWLRTLVQLKLVVAVNIVDVVAEMGEVVGIVVAEVVAEQGVVVVVAAADETMTAMYEAIADMLGH